MPSDRKIGYFFAGLCLIIGLWPLLAAPRTVSWVWLALSGILMLVAIFKPIHLRPLNHLWMGLGRVFQKIFPPVFLTLVYWTVFTPIAVVVRVFGRPAVDLRWKAEDVESWWEYRSRPGPPSDSIHKQY